MELSLAVLSLGLLTIYMVTFLKSKEQIKDIKKFRLACFMLPLSLFFGVIAISCILGVAIDRDSIGGAIVFGILTYLLLIVSLCYYLRSVLYEPIDTTVNRTRKKQSVSRRNNPKEQPKEEE